jgi:hypothetical protein
MSPAPGEGIGTKLKVIAMSFIRISPWRRKRGHNPRYSVYDGPTRLGDIFESGGIFTSVNASGDLIAAATSVQAAANALTASHALVTDIRSRFVTGQSSYEPGCRP